MIRLSLSADQMLEIESPAVALRRAQPILNGVPLTAWHCEALELDEERIELRYTSSELGEGTLRIQALRSQTQDCLVLRYWLEDLPKDTVLDSFGLCFEQVENVHQYLRNGYFSWDGSYYVQPEALDDVYTEMSHL